MKARYDYGLLIFILTFCLVSVSGYRDENVLDMAHKRVSTILVGGFTALCVCIFIYPVWAGDDLHNLAANNIEKLASFLEGKDFIFTYCDLNPRSSTFSDTLTKIIQCILLLYKKTVY